MNRAKSVLQTKLSRIAATTAFVAAGGAFAFMLPVLPPADTAPFQTSFVREASAEVTNAGIAGSGRVKWDISNLDNRRVDMWIEIYSEGKLRPKFATWLERKTKYEKMISRELAERDMPQDLIYLAMIESGFNPKAYSRAHAGGMWQFVSETGRRYGLKINRRVDERRNPEKATEAALAYLSDLHDRFGSWYLAAAAYNTGENRVGRIMRTVTGKEHGTDRDYYRILSRLPRETRDYVPMMIAAARISKQPAKYGFASD